MSAKEEALSGSKACRGKIGCGKVKPYSAFHSNPRSVDGYRSSCKACTAAAMKAHTDRFTAQFETGELKRASKKTCHPKNGCGKTKPGSEFNTRNTTSDGLQTYCRDCSNKKGRDNAKAHSMTPKGVITKMLSAARTRAKHQDNRFSIDYDYVWGLYEAQGGVCAVTSVEFDFSDPKGSTRKDAVSIDQIVAGQGYVEGNVRLVTSAVNRAIGEFGDQAFLSMCEAAIATRDAKK